MEYESELEPCEEYPLEDDDDEERDADCGNTQGRGVFGTEPADSCERTRQVAASIERIHVRRLEFDVGLTGFFGAFIPSNVHVVPRVALSNRG
ncbi:hypothetical protein [Halomicrobium zhouii]|uniref:hypothetical protein n=1 Tax=Halomicrobium zhouii TaxID=767519 RepID=UPI001160E137|nr:hypothetical protein [Halomicrobium zhouii]